MRARPLMRRRMVGEEIKRAVATLGLSPRGVSRLQNTDIVVRYCDVSIAYDALGKQVREHTRTEFPLGTPPPPFGGTQKVLESAQADFVNFPDANSIRRSIQLSVDSARRGRDIH